MSFSLKAYVKILEITPMLMIVVLVVLRPAVRHVYGTVNFDGGDNRAIAVTQLAHQTRVGARFMEAT